MRKREDRRGGGGGGGGQTAESGDDDEASWDEKDPDDKSRRQAGKSDTCQVSKAVLNFLLHRDERNLVSGGINIRCTFQTNPRQLDYSHETEPPPIFLRPIKIWLSCQSSPVSCLASSIIQPLSLSSTKTYIPFLLYPFLTFVRDNVMSSPKKEEKE